MMLAIMAVALGGMVSIFLVSLLVGRFIFKNKEIKKKITYSTLVSYLIAVLLSGFGNANGGPFNPMFFDEYFISTVMLIALRLLLIKIRERTS